jgi:CRISPR-associated exonuclease Cas4
MTKSRPMSVVELIYEWIVKQQLEKLSESRDPRVIYVTDLVVCTHKFHMRKSFPELGISFEPSAVLGDIAHIGLGKLLSEKGFSVEVEVSREVEIENVKYLLKGRVDALSVDKSVVVEVKTSKSAVGLPREHHVKQLKIYLELLGAKHGVLVYITPDKLVEYHYDYEPVDLEAEVQALLANTQHPRYPWECSYCTYRKLCPYAQLTKGN